MLQKRYEIESSELETGDNFCVSSAKYNADVVVCLSERRITADCGSLRVTEVNRACN